MAEMTEREKELFADVQRLTSANRDLLGRLYAKGTNEHATQACDFAALLAHERQNHDRTRTRLEHTKAELVQLIDRHKRIMEMVRDARDIVLEFIGEEPT